MVQEYHASRLHTENRDHLPNSHSSTRQAGAGEALGYLISIRRISNSVKLAKVVPIIAELVTATGRGQ